MAEISQNQVFERFLRDGRNSSHFVWFLANLQFYECRNGYIFGYTKHTDTYLFAFEPLFPEEKFSSIELNAALKELEEIFKPKVFAFVAVYEEFLNLLKREKFQTLQVGREPYVRLADCIPTGKAGKSVRAGRNQALRAGLTVKEWNREEILSQPKIKTAMETILKAWRARNLIELGYLNTVDPFVHMNHRRYFLATTADGDLEGFVVCTPIPGKKSYFLEDMILRPNSTRGTGELLTLEALIGLQSTGAETASLGVVSLTTIDESSAYNLPEKAKFLLISLPKFLRKFVNVDGLEMFRRRFKPEKWENVSIAVKNMRPSVISDNRAWFSMMTSLLKSFSPRWNFSFQWLKQTITHPLRKNPVSYGILSLFIASFVLINRCGTLPEWALNNLGFSGTVALYEWPFRSLISDFLFFDFTHFIWSFIGVFFFVRWMESTHPKAFVAKFILTISILDDIINQVFLILPNFYFRPHLISRLLYFSDVGPSLWIATCVGFQLVSLKKNRELLFAGFLIAIISYFAFSVNHIANLALNINHVLFFIVGYIAGKLRFEHERKLSRSVAKNKPPVAKSVRTAEAEAE
jgi:hypothetical protein